MADDLWLCDLPTIEYREALALQEAARTARQADEIPDTLLLLDHWPVYTRGRRSKPEELPMGEDWYRSQGFDIVDTRRGGLLTYHGPGQLVGYTIMRVEDVVGHLRTIEQAIVATLADHGVEARPRVEDGPAYTGVWVGPCKVASLGVHVSRGVAMHGFSVNVQNDLQPFTYVVACGLDAVSPTSVLSETQGSGDLLTPFRARMAERFAEAFGRTITPVTREQLPAPATTSA